MITLLRQLALLLVFPALLAACGGGGGGAGNPGGQSGNGPVPAVPAPVTPSVANPLPTANAISLQSEQGDPIGQGKSYQYTPANASISVTASRNRLVVKVEGDEAWTGVVQTGGNATELKVGEYTALPRYQDGMDASQGGLTWWGNDRSCTSSTGWVAIDSVAYADGQLVAISLRFQRNCNGAAAALRGTVNYTVNDRSTGASPASLPGDLWRPPSTVAASVGNYAYFESADGDYVGLGKTYLFDRRSAPVTVSGSGMPLDIQVEGDDMWAAEIRAPSAQFRLAPGYYPDVKAARFSNPVKGGMSWIAAGRGCSTSTGWFAVDVAEYDASGTIKRLDLRFEQHCEGRAAPLRGAIHYDDSAQPAGNPVANTAAGAWRAPAAVQARGDNFMYVESDANEALARGMTDLQTSATAAFDVDNGNSNTLRMTVSGNRMWSFTFRMPARFGQIVPGSYYGVTTPPGDSVGLGALHVAAGNYGCDAEKGWVVVDNASYAAGKLVAVELRFEQQCAPQSGLLHGHVRWRANVPDAFPGPAAVPDLFWRPSAALPAGSYVYLTSDRSDFVGIGEALYTPVDAALRITEQNGKLLVDVKGDTNWSGTFETMRNAGTILPGYYAGLTGTTTRPARGRFSWGGDGRGCASVSGVVVDKAVYSGGQLSELQLRFEQHCQSEPGASRGQIRWLASDTRQPAGPRTAIPGGLWSAPAGALPAGGNYLYVAGTPGEPITDGKTYLLAQKNASLYFTTAASYADPKAGFLSLTADSGTPDGGRFKVDFQTMSSVSQLQPGLYEHLLRFSLHNPAFGGLGVTGMGIGCNGSIGWMVLDKVTYANGKPSAVHGRFEHVCEGSAAPLHGEFNWEG